jgi:hypothetical protein
MENLIYRNYRSVVATLAAVVIVGLTGLTLDRGHSGATPEGIVEIGELQTQMVGETPIATLPAIEVTGRHLRLADAQG